MKFGWTIIYVADVEATLTFYERCFGFERKFITDEADYGELITGETTLAFSQNDLATSLVGEYRPNTPDLSPMGMELTFMTDDVPTAFAQAVEGGAVVVREPHDKPWGQTVAYVRDLNGVLVEIATPIG